MIRRLLTVDDTFLVQSYGLVLFPGIVPQGDEQFRVGDLVLLKSPNDSWFSSAIGWLEVSTIELVPNEPSCEVHILLFGLGKEDVPTGTEVWSCVVYQH